MEWDRTPPLQQGYCGAPAVGPPGFAGVVMLVSESVGRDLERLPVDLRGSGLAATALALAAEIDAPGNSATSKSMCAKALLDALDRIRALAPPERKVDGIDRIAKQREKRRAAGSS